ncbi:MAG: AMP-binding protein [Methanomicrobiales archaeon]|nr:AMP-binding protein [Methanomicrobiales archaeon]
MPARSSDNKPDPEDRYRNFSIQVPEFFNFGYDVVDIWAEKEPDKTALLWVNQQGEEKRYSFWDMKMGSDAAARLLQESGIGPGARVFVMLPRIPEWWILVVALIKRGAVYTPATTLLTSHDISYRLKAGGFALVITDRENAPKVQEAAREQSSKPKCMVVDGDLPGWISYPEEMASGTRTGVHIPAVKTRSSDSLLIFFTSGTTGNPKMVLHDHSYALGHIVTARLWQDVKPSDLHFTITDTGWAKSAWGNLFGQWIEGTAVFVYDIRGKFDPAEIPPLLMRYGITTFCCPPTIYRMLILLDLKRYNFSRLRHCLSAGEPLNPEVIRIWKEKTGLPIYEGYGQTETVLCIGAFPGRECPPGSMGKPAPGWHVELHDRHGRPVGVNREGRIAISLNPRPVGLFQEYIGNDAANRKSFVKGWYYTDDKAALDEDGYFWFIGRDDDVIKASGYRIGPFEVESALLEHPSVAEAAVVGSPDPIRGTIVKAFVVLKPGFVPSDRLMVDLQEHVKQVTAPYKYPRAIEFVDSLPKTHSGKIRRNELREREVKKGETG